MNQEEQEAKRQEALDEAFQRAGAFEEMVNTNGFKYIKANYVNQIQLFINDMLSQEDKPITDFEGKRRELMGLRKVFGQIDSDLTFLADERNKRKSE